MTKRIGVAVVGAGMAGQAHAFGYRNASMHPDLAGQVGIDLVAVVDANQELATTTAARYGFAAAHTDIQAVLDDPAVDAVSVALPNNQYIEAIPRLLAAGSFGPGGACCPEVEPLLRCVGCRVDGRGLWHNRRDVPACRAAQRERRRDR